jgi:leader peptidase (prepilin peptidase)/N-methyltransferase
MNIMTWVAEHVRQLVAEQPYLCLALALVIGAIVGGFLNICIYRLPLQKSVFWPGPRCSHCLQRIRWYDNIPILSYWLLGGRCRTCNAGFSFRYLWVEFLTGLSFAGLFYLVVMKNVRGVETQPFDPPQAVPVEALVVIWGYHAILASFLIVATFTDIDYQDIPLGITIPGTILGVIGGVLWPWPWPLPVNRLPPPEQWDLVYFGGLGYSDPNVRALPIGLQPWPVWMPAPEWLPPGSWQMGLATALAGAVLGTGLVRLIRFIFGWGLGKEAMGLGDADLMMMIGAFLGWQSLVGVLFFAVFLGLFYAVFLVLTNRGHELPFGPFLAGGAVLTMLFTWPLAAWSQTSFFELRLIVILVGMCSVLAFFMTLSIRMFRLILMASQK